MAYFESGMGANFTLAPLPSTNPKIITGSWSHRHRCRLQGSAQFLG